jgi:diguanylate cyclase (GGDEF)-like protein
MEVLYQSHRTIVSRARSKAGGGSVIVKQSLGPDAMARQRHESRMLKRLAGVAGVSQLLSVGPGAMLTLQDRGGRALEGPLAPPVLVALATRLARSLAEVHRRGVLHLDIARANIIRCADGAPELIDFHLASASAGETRRFGHHTEVEGTLTTLAPELTGRMGQAIDHRADLYAFGAMLYDLATGEPPFGRGDTLKLLRDHAATLPVSPDQRRPGLPQALCGIILRLLEKSPDRRYQSADGLADDLERLQRVLATGGAADFPLGSTDFPLRLAAPARLIGREAALCALDEAFADAVSGGCRMLLVAGPRGTGKTALLDQLRPIAAVQDGWFVGAAFDCRGQHGRVSPIFQLLRGIASRLLAEPEAALVAMRAALRARLGEDAALLVPIVPEIVDILGVPPPCEAAAEPRVRAACLTFLGAVASAARPLVMVLDDLHWAPESALQQIGEWLASDLPPGILLAAAYDSNAQKAASPLALAVARWQRTLGVRGRVRRLEIANLTPPELSEMLGVMLRLPREAASALAGAVGARTAGNPADLLDLLDALRREGTLTRGERGWQWDRGAIQRHVGDWEMFGVLLARVAALPAMTGHLLANMACLGGELLPEVLAAASGIAGGELYEALLPALDDGLVVLERQAGAAAAKLRFRSGRVQQAIHAGIGALAAQARHLAMARLLMLDGAFDGEAAEQCLHALPALGPEEATQAAMLLERAAHQAAGTFRHESAERYFAAAIALRERRPASSHDRGLLTGLRAARLAALDRLGRREECDRLFAAIARDGDDRLVTAEAACVQVLSLTNRGRHADALAIGLAEMERLGIRPPPGDLAPDVARGLDRLRAWLTRDMALRAQDRLTANDPLVRAASRLISRMLPAAQLANPLLGAWLGLESQRLWARHGVCQESVANLAYTAASLTMFNADFRAGYAGAKHAIAVGVAQGYEPATALARSSCAAFAMPWFERLDSVVAETAAARVCLIGAGESQAACENFLISLDALFDAAPTLEAYAAEIEAALEFTALTRSEQHVDSLHHHQGLLQVLTGKGDAAVLLADATPPAAPDGRPGLNALHSTRAIMAALFGDADALERFSAAAMPMPGRRTAGTYRLSTMVVLRAMSLAQSGRRPGPPCPLPEAFSTSRDWLAARAVDAPANFAHLLHFLDAEAAWTAGGAAAAVRAFDRALQGCAGQSRPWHHAMIAERAGLFHLSEGQDYIGRALLRDALARYEAWGATAVVRRLCAAHGFLESAAPRHGDAAPHSSSLSSDAVDLLAILRASQALSSQTSIAGLLTHLVETLASMTGATACTLLIWDAARQGWFLPATDGVDPEPAAAAAARGAVPLSALYVVERTRAPLLVDDARLDDRFLRDPYFAGMERCSLLVLPVQSQGAARAMLMLENRLSRGVFSHARLNLVSLVASQLAVSLDNAQLYASLERRVAERTEALAVANRRLELLSISDGLTGLANRRCFDDLLQSEWLRGLRAGTSLGLAIVDIDHFKKYNDHYGHVGGDRCLRAVSTALQLSVRQDVDLAARYGGEEFALVLPGADQQVAEEVARRAHAAVLAAEEPHAAAPLGQVTISVGVVALVPDEGMGPEGLIEMADAALYRAKQEGRNRVVCHEPQTQGRWQKAVLS